jgi:copper(I)-binding protein
LRQLSRPIVFATRGLSMPHPIHRRALLHAGIAVAAGCVVTPSRACEVQLANLRLMHPWARATPTGADSAILNMTIEDVTEADRLTGVQCIAAAGSALGGPQAAPVVDFVIPAGRTTVLGEDGTHVVLTGLRFPLHVGRVFPLLVTFEKGGIAMASLHIDFPAVA